MPAKQRYNAATLRLVAQQVMRERAIFDAPLELEFFAELAIPQSWSKKRQTMARDGAILPGGRPDLSNFLKQVEDALNGVAYRDDSLITTAIIKKRYGPQPKVVITLTPEICADCRYFRLTGNVGGGT